MQQLNGLDSMFLYIEQPGLPMTISSLMIYDPSTAPQGTVRFKDILKTFENGMAKASIFRRRVVTVPANLDHPYWIEDPDFDLEFHVRHIALPQPGDWRQLYIQVARLQARVIDRSRPLWEAYIIEGLNKLEGVPPGSFAVLLKVHHAAMDGKTGVNMFLAMHDFEPKSPAASGETLLARESQPARSLLLLNTAKNYGTRALRFGGMAADNVRLLRRVQKAKREGSIHNVQHKVHTRFNDSPSAHRAVTSYVMPRDKCEALRKLSEGATLNDVMLTIISGALRRYLHAKGELPEGTLVAGCPVDIRNDENRDSEENLVGIMNVSICSDEPDPLKRLDAIRRESIGAKYYHQQVGPGLVNETAKMIPPYLLGIGIKGFLKVADRFPAIQNTLVSNVPGLDFPVYFAGAKLINGFGLGPVMPHCNLFHTVSSLMGNMTLGINACREAMPDPEFYRQCIDESWCELSACLDAPAPTPQKTRTRKQARAKSTGKPSARKAKASQSKGASK